MRRHFLWAALLLYGCFISPAFAAEKPTMQAFALKQSASGYTLSYMLEVKNKQKAFFASTLDALKSGKKLAFTHHIKLYKLGGWRKSKIVDKKVVYQVRYNLMQNIFTLKRGGEEVFITGEKGLAKELFKVEKEDIGTLKNYEAGTEVLAKVAFSFKDVGQKNTWVFRIIPQWFTPKITAEVLYVAK